jgi:hypothetical protein
MVRFLRRLAPGTDAFVLSAAWGRQPRGSDGGRNHLPRTTRSIRRSSSASRTTTLRGAAGREHRAGPRGRRDAPARGLRGLAGHAGARVRRRAGLPLCARVRLTALRTAAPGESPGRAPRRRVDHARRIRAGRGVGARGRPGARPWRSGHVSMSVRRDPCAIELRDASGRVMTRTLPFDGSSSVVDVAREWRPPG